MTLPDILTFLGLLITAFGATQDYIRLKFRLASKFLLTPFNWRFNGQAFEQKLQEMGKRIRVRRTIAV